MSRKVFISVLGFSHYNECKYTFGSFKSQPVRFIQEATLDYLNRQSSWTDTDIAYILLTDGAEKANWDDDGHKDRDTGAIVRCEGLRSRLKKMGLPFMVNTINNLPDGNTEEEIWSIFERVFNELREGDELYFDLTHGFRYLPMLVMVLINYSKFLKNTSVKSITYGNYESRNRVTNEAPIIDLLPLSVLQDWTYAAGQFLDSGNVHRLVGLSKDKISPVLRETKGSDKEAKLLQTFIKYLEASVQDMQTCRGINIVESIHVGPLIEVIPQLQSSFIKPLNPVFEKIRKRFGAFACEPNVKNGFVGAKWCLDNGLYQQAITILQETIVTLICVEQELDYTDKKQRGIINSIFSIHKNNIPEEKWAYPFGITEEEKVKQRSLIVSLLKDDSVCGLSELFSVCTGIRNDFNHSGMSNNPGKSERLKENIKDQVNKVMKLVYG